MAGGVYAGDHFASSGSRRPTPKAAATPPTTTPLVTPKVTAPAPPPTTVPPPAVTSQGRSSTSANYAVAATSVNVSLVVTYRCWVEVRKGSENGPVTFENILNPGVSQNFQANGGLWIRLGDPVGVTMSIDGAPVPLPHVASPFNVAVSGSSST